jgi:general nucleoside transport system permease protein
VLASLLMSALYLGGESAQMELQLPASVSGLFQGVLLFYLLAAELFIGFRLRRMRRPPSALSATEGAATSGNSA